MAREAVEPHPLRPTGTLGRSVAASLPLEGGELGPEACAVVGVALRKARRIPDARSNRPDTGVRLENVGSPGPCPEAGGPAPSVVLGSGWPP